MTRVEAFLERIESRDATIGVIGLGYVGLPVATTFAKEGFKVIGIDLDKEKVASIESGESHLLDVDHETVATLRKQGRLRASTSFRRLKDADAILICVPTPLTEGAPDLSRVIGAAKGVAKVLKEGALVILESTTYPGTTDEVLCPLLSESGLKCGEDFFLAFSPERIDPGNPMYDFADIPKVVGGVNDDSTRAAAALYETVVPKVVPVKGSKEAELAKLIENTFRHVNIGLVNELAVYAHEMDIDIWEAIEAASTKPFGYIPFWPGPGWGGHCIPLDPAYLSWRVRRDRAHEVRFVELAHAVNSEMPRHVVERISVILSDRLKTVRNARIMGVGVAYKGGTEDTRESAGLKVLSALAKRGAEISYHDPLVQSVTIGDQVLNSTPITDESMSEVDLVVILAPQHGVDWNDLYEKAPYIFDCCNAMKMRNGKVVRL
jgi:UDP-N-acetyl-D-glucosamine dehydrogenase